jgi:hypothetical protein
MIFAPDEYDWIDWPEAAPEPEAFLGWLVMVLIGFWLLGLGLMAVLYAFVVALLSL